MVFPHSAEQAYLDTLSRNPDDVAALDGLGMLAARTGRLDAALVALTRAAELAPYDAQIQTHLAHVFHDRGEWEAARLQYSRALYLAPDDALAHEGAAYTAMRLSDLDTAEKHRTRAFRNRVLTYSSVDVAAPTVLLVLSSYGGNVDTRPFLAAEPVNVIKLIAEELHHVTSLPEFDYVFNGIGDGDRHRNTRVSLSALEVFLKTCKKRVINRPEAVMATSRANNARRLASIPGVRTPRIVTIERSGDPASLALLISSCLTYPLLVRAPGYQTGEHFYRAESEHDLRRILPKLPGDDILAMEFIDTSDEHGVFRKYRMMSIGGNVYPAHVAVSRAWKVHNRNTLTFATDAYRAEDQAYIEDPESVVGNVAYRALKEIARTIDLDYAGIDFALDRDRRVVCFEANATMVIPLPDSQPQFAARRNAALRIHHATKRLLGL